MPHEHGTGQTAWVATETLEHEHRVIHRVVAAMTRLAEELEHGSDPEPQTLDGLLSFLQVYMDQCHHSKEDRWLFPMLEAKGIPSGGCPIGALEHEHERGRALGAQLAEAVQSYKAEGPAAAKPLLIRTLRDLVDLYPRHIWKEDYLLLPLANRVLPAEDQRKLVEGFDQVEAQIDPGVHERMEAFPATLERAVGRLAEARGAGVAPVRTPEPTGAPALAFDVNECIERLMLEKNWQAGRDSQTIVKYADFRIVLTVLRAGSHLHEHHAAGPVSVHTIRGHIRMRVEGRTVDLSAGHVLALDRAVPHDVEAVEDSAFLLTIAWPSSGRV
ncbi:MAG: hemerythrin domain-containing protein [Acidobacteriota bacterium]